MEVFNSDSLKSSSYRSAINQSGKGDEMDRYIYSNQSGEGIASFFGNLFRTAVPLIGRAIKGVASIAKPHLKSAAREIIATGSKRAIKRLSGTHKEHAPRRRKKVKWRSL